MQFYLISYENKTFNIILSNKPSVATFFKTPNMKTRFLTSLKICSINSVIINLNDSVIILLHLTMNSEVWQFKYTDFYSNSAFIFYYVYIYLPIWTVAYTFGGKASTIIWV